MKSSGALVYPKDPFIIFSVAKKPLEQNCLRAMPPILHESWIAFFLIPLCNRCNGCKPSPMMRATAWHVMSINGAAWLEIWGRRWGHYLNLSEENWERFFRTGRIVSPFASKKQKNSGKSPKFRTVVNWQLFFGLDGKERFCGPSWKVLPMRLTFLRIFSSPRCTDDFFCQ